MRSLNRTFVPVHNTNSASITQLPWTVANALPQTHHVSNINPHHHSIPTTTPDTTTTTTTPHMWQGQLYCNTLRPHKIGWDLPDNIFNYRKITNTVETPYNTIPCNTIFHITRWVLGPQNSRCSTLDLKIQLSQVLDPFVLFTKNTYQ